MPPSEEMDLEQLGYTGLNEYGGYVYEEESRALRGPRGVKVYREMGDNDPVVGSMLYAITSLCRQVEWRTEPAVDGDERSLEEAEFVESCRADMAGTWEDLIGEVLEEVRYGWSYFEEVYKIRRGPDEADAKYRSRYSDGRVGWRKIAGRSQDSLTHWQIDDDGGIRGMHQRTHTGESAWLPIEKCLLFRTSAPKNNPEGRSLLRNAWRPWRFVKRLEELEGIGIERELAGLPVFEVPPTWLGSGATANQKAIVTSLKKMGQEIRNNEHACLITPAEKVTDGGKEITTGFKFYLANSGGSRQIQPDVAIKRHQSRMAMTLLSQWLLLGQDAHGSFSLASTTTNMFAVSLGALLDGIASVFNDYAIPKLMRLNDVPAEFWPRLVHGDVEDVDISAVSDALSKLVTSGLMTPDPAMERKLREMAGLPQPEIEDVEGDGSEFDQPLAPAAASGKDENVQSKALNGAQVASMVEVVSAVNDGRMSRESGVALLMVSFQLSEEDAAKVLGPAGFRPATPASE